MRSNILLIMLVLAAFLSANYAASEETAKTKDKKISMRDLAPISAIAPIEDNQDSQPSVQGWLRLLLHKHFMNSPSSIHKQNTENQKTKANPSHSPRKMLSPFPPRKPRAPIKPIAVEDLGEKRRER